MKTLKALTAVLLIIFSVSAFADENNKNAKSKMEATVVTYVDAMKNGKVKDLSALFDQDLKYTISRGDVILNYNKTELLAELKNHENIIQNCDTDYSIIESNPVQSIVKVNLKYESFTKVNFVTLSNTSKGWKITNISSSYSTSYQ
ncbi:nuclear transport factor 2 family protein [Pararcticibacter amylolyticus]|uniref:Lumazine-binding protein n=1 Tax=Pararcticibacter amylolyticus TaxID=2173175 RepID=A0A2U2PAV5_9SPHI|nr:nuclear transport factor 2 family protein [Pararcticibacter amylolyticus]PWG78493.1 hypothetical protein DDR33_21950 [Pararcticibacter amylolyticus]